MERIKLLSSDEGKPYVSLDDLICEFETLIDIQSWEEDDPELLRGILGALRKMEQEFYMKLITHIEEHHNQNNEIQPIIKAMEEVDDDPEADLINELLKKVKFPRIKVRKKQSLIEDEIDKIAGAHLIIGNWKTEGELNKFKEKMIGIRSICTHAVLKYDHWKMLFEEVQKHAISIEELIEMVQKRIDRNQQRNTK